MFFFTWKLLKYLHNVLPYFFISSHLDIYTHKQQNWTKKYKNNYIVDSSGTYINGSRWRLDTQYFIIKVPTTRIHVVEHTKTKEWTQVMWQCIDSSVSFCSDMARLRRPIRTRTLHSPPVRSLVDETVATTPQTIVISTVSSLLSLITITVCQSVGLVGTRVVCNLIL